MKSNNNKFNYNLNAASFIPKSKGNFNQQYDSNHHNFIKSQNNYYNQGNYNYDDNQNYNQGNYNNYDNQNYNQGNYNNYDNQNYNQGKYNYENDQNFNQGYNNNSKFNEKTNKPQKSNKYQNYQENNMNYQNYANYQNNQEYHDNSYKNNQNYSQNDIYNYNQNYQENNYSKGKNNYNNKTQYQVETKYNDNNQYTYSQDNNFNKDNNYNKGQKNFKNNFNSEIENNYVENDDYYTSGKKYNKGKTNNQKEYQKPKEEKIEVIQRIVDSNSKQVKVVHKDLKSTAKPYFNQDLEDDCFDEETCGFDSTYKDLDDDEQGYDDEDYAYGEGKFDENDEEIEEDYGVSDNFSDQFSKGLRLDKKSEIKNQLIFNNQESFTDYVDKLLTGESRRNSQINDSFVNVLMIAEKPSIAKSIADALSSGKYKSNNCGRGKTLISFDGYFGEVKARFTVSSVMGHVYTSDFQKEHNQWSNIDALDLYEVPVVKLEANPKTRIPSNLSNLASGKDILCLWLDCDKEGENICFEVINNTYKYMNKKSYQQIYRAKFSSLTKQDLKVAFNSMKERPNKYQSLSVDVRQVIDLKIGVSFTRFLTSSILPGLKDIETNLISYGPCQTPTLWFCVNRLREINSFVSKEYFRIYTEIEVKKIKKKIFYCKNFNDKNSTNEFLKKFQDTKKAVVVEVEVKTIQKTPPAGMNTVQLLRIASSYLKISPHHTMQIAEKLYTMGYVTYPRTETTKYAPSFDFKKALNDFSNHSVFGQKINTHILKNYQRPILKGVDVGDHPPITPARVAEPSELKGDQWRLYELICTNFFASLSPSAEYEERLNTINIENEIFTAESMNIVKDGFLAFMPWKRGNYIKDFPLLTKDMQININSVSFESCWTQPPSHLTESDLIKLMEKNKIGTDASMPVHIENICNRGYVTVDESRKLMPTNLGKALIESLSFVDPELVQPTIRAEIEGLVDLIAKGKKPFSEILKYTMDLYKKKFLLVRQNYEKMILQFRKYFTVDSVGILNISKNIKKQNQEYRSQIQVKKSEKEIMESIIKSSCFDCGKGKMYIDYDSFDKFILLCTSCKLRKKLIRDAVKIDLDNTPCPDCSARLCCVEIEYPLITGEKKITGCLFCDDRINYRI